MTKILIKEQVKEIKARLWAGETHQLIASSYTVGISTISRIAQGKAFYDISWPDGTVGPLPTARQIEIHRGRFASLRASAVKSQLAKLTPVRPAALARAIHSAALDEDEADERVLVEAVKDVDSPQEVKNVTKPKAPRRGRTP